MTVRRPAMVYRANKFTPQVLLSAPRRSIGVPNSDASLILYTTSTYSFDTHSQSYSLCVLRRDKDSARYDANCNYLFGYSQRPPTTGGETNRLASAEGISNLNWLDYDDLFTFLYAGKNGETKLVVASLKAITASGEMDLATSSEGKGYYVAGSIQAPAANLKVKSLTPGKRFAVAVTARASPDGSLYNSETAKPTHSTGRLYSTIQVREWDRYETKERNTLWYAQLDRSNKGDRFKLSSFTNAHPRLGLECPIPPFGGTDNFDISSYGIIFVAKDPNLSRALNNKCNAYLLKISDWGGGEAPKPLLVQTPGFDGAATSPVFSDDGSQVAFLKMKTNGHDAERNVIFGFGTADVPDMVAAQIAASSWDLSPTSVQFSTTNPDRLYVTASDSGVGRLFVIDRDESWKPPVGSNTGGNVLEVRPLPGGEIFLSMSSLIDSSIYVLLHSDGDGSWPLPEWASSVSEDGSKYGLSVEQRDSLWTPAGNPTARNPRIHSLVMRPSDFDRTKKYPVAYIIHGGPSEACVDIWSYKWNPAVFAEQGYIVIMPNFTGSSGYGAAFTDASRCNWGGTPYEDIVNAFDWISENMPEADNDRAVALGGSYGGYMVNWIQGHDLGRKFKALVCHDGVTSFAGCFYSTDDFYFPMHELGGVPWNNDQCAHIRGDNPFTLSTTAVGARSLASSSSSRESSWRKWDPSAFFSEWQTPELVIHSSKDYRIAISEGLAAFNILQARGVESQFLTFPDENHLVSQPENSLVWYKTVLNFINKFVGKRPFTIEDPEGEEYFGGIKEEEVVVSSLGKVTI